MNIRRKKKIFLWVTGLDDFINGKGVVGGLTVQMYFWSRVFIKKQWSVYSLTRHKKNSNRSINGVCFSYLSSFPGASPVFEFFKIIYSFVFLKPDLIITRGATRSLFCLAFFSRVFRIKLVAFMASDSDLKPGSELIKSLVDRKLFEFGLKLCSYIVCQNEIQSLLLRQNYGSRKNEIIIPNIWLREEDSNEQRSSRNGVLWVGNFRELKRPDWFLHLAKKKKDETFVMIGNALDQVCYNRIETESKKISNLNFIGGCSFFEVQNYFKKCRLFVCTSTIEGFPNTFLQAWSNGVPVITTFDPSGIVASNQLGFVVKNEEELSSAAREFDNDKLWKTYSSRVLSFFQENYSFERAYNTLLQLVNH